MQINIYIKFEKLNIQIKNMPKTILNFSKQLWHYKNGLDASNNVY